MTEYRSRGILVVHCLILFALNSTICEHLYPDVDPSAPLNPIICEHVYPEGDPSAPLNLTVCGHFYPYGDLSAPLNYTLCEHFTHTVILVLH